MPLWRRNVINLRATTDERWSTNGSSKAITDRGTAFKYLRLWMCVCVWWKGFVLFYGTNRNRADDWEIERENSVRAPWTDRVRDWTVGPQAKTPQLYLATYSFSLRHQSRRQAYVGAPVVFEELTHTQICEVEAYYFVASPSIFWSFNFDVKRARGEVEGKKISTTYIIWKEKWRQMKKRRRGKSASVCYLFIDVGQST